MRSLFRSLTRLSPPMALTALVAAGLPVPTATAAALEQWSVASPTGSISALVTLDSSDGSLRLSASRAGRTVLAPAPVGLRTTAADLSRGLHALSTSRQTVTQQYTMTTGKRRVRANQLNELRVALADAAGRRLDLVVRAAPDGVAYRYVVPGPVTVTGEASAFTVPAAAPAWLLPYNAWYEQNRTRTTAGGAAVADFGNPSLFRVGQDFVLLTESDVDGRYSGARLRHTTAGAGTYQVLLADGQVSSAGQLRTPWRTAIVGDLPAVTESTLVDDLAQPARFTDTSWIRPGKVAWSWLSEHSSPSDFNRQKQFVDFAARNGWPYSLVDEGWSATWVPDLVRYARARGVDILLWFAWTDLDTAQERDTVLNRVKQWGARGVKIDFMNSDSQSRYQWYDAVLAKTAELHLMVNFHGSTIPHGIARTWPHIMSMEGVRGAENFPPAANNSVQTFTRNVVGSMDYTPVSLDVGIHEATIAHEAALPVAFESGWTHFADKPEAYDRFPGVLRFLDQVPTVWDETRLLSGSPGDHAIFARRNGSRWFIGAITAGNARTLTVPLRFLGSGDWLVEVIRDGSSTQRLDVTRSRQVLNSASTLSVPVPNNGGFAAILCPNGAGTQTCDQPIRPVPTSTLTINPASADAAPGGSFDVTGTFTLNQGGPVSNVMLTAAAPAGWTISGPAISAPTLRNGETITGRWTVHVGQSSPVGFVDVPVFAEFRTPDPARTEPVHVEQAVRALVPPPVPSGTPFVSDLVFLSESNGWGPIERDRSNGENAAGDGNPISIGGVRFAKGIGAHAPSELTVFLGRRCTAFTASIGQDDEILQPGSVVFQVVGDDRVLFDSGVIAGRGGARPVTVDTTGIRMLSLRVTDAGDGRNFDHADWANAQIRCA